MSKTGGNRQYDTQLWNLDWSYTVHLESGPAVFSLNRVLSEDDNPHVESLIPYLSWTGKIPDARAEWHRNYTPIGRWFRAHLLRCIRDDTHQELKRALEDEPELAARLGFFEGSASVIDEYDETGAGHGIPGYTHLRDMWEKEFSPRTRGACTVLAERLVEYARNQGFPAPDDVFIPDDDVKVDDPSEDHPTVRELTIEKTGDVWQHARPMVLNHWYLKRHHNWQIPEANFYDGHAALAATSDDVFPESGIGNMSAKSDHNRVQYPSTHRRELKKFDTDEIRDLHQSVTEELIQEARSNGELVGSIKVAIDQTKGHPWTGEIDRNPGGSNAEEWILGYSNDNDTRTQYYFQWATIQVVGLDIPLVLDALPVKRGLTKGDIVDELLDTATDLLDDIELVMMDGGFDSGAAKNAAEKHETYYINRKSRDATDKQRMREMWSDGETVRIVEEEDRLGMPVRKTVYVPHINGDDEDDEETPDESLRQQLITDFEGLDADELPEESPFETLLSDIHDDEDEGSEEIDPTEQYVVFETNHPLVNNRGGRGNDPIPKEEQIQAAARLIRRYGIRWGIENGFKKLGHFLPRSGSKDHTLRFFGFAFAATLYNCWRLVDLLVKLTVEDNPDYTPLVTASRFLAVAEGQFGLSKPPPS